jgi:hypothetical protein
MNARRFCLLLLLGLAFVAQARAEEVWLGTAEVSFKGYSFLHDFTGTVNRVPLKVLVSQGANGRIVSATSAVEVKEMNTREEARDRGMRQMFDEAQYHIIKVEVVNADERQLKPQGAQPGTMLVTLTIAGRRGTVSGAITKISESRDAVSFDLAFPISLKMFNLNPPAALAGIIKVKDTVDVTVHVTVQRRAP